MRLPHPLKKRRLHRQSHMGNYDVVARVSRYNQGWQACPEGAACRTAPASSSTRAVTGETSSDAPTGLMLTSAAQIRAGLIQSFFTILPGLARMMTTTVCYLYFFSGFAAITPRVNYGEKTIKRAGFSSKRAESKVFLRPFLYLAPPSAFLSTQSWTASHLSVARSFFLSTLKEKGEGIWHAEKERCTKFYRKTPPTKKPTAFPALRKPSTLAAGPHDG